MIDEPGAKRKSIEEVGLLNKIRKRRRSDYLGTATSEGSFDRKHHFSSWLSSVTSMPGITINLQLSISRDSSSSGN